MLPLQRADAWGCYHLTLGLGGKESTVSLSFLFKAASSSGMFPHSPLVVTCAHLPEDEGQPLLLTSGGDVRR